MNALFIRTAGVLVLAITLGLYLCGSSFVEAAEDQAVRQDTGLSDRGTDEEAVTGPGTEASDEIPGIQPPSGPTDAELQGEKPRRRWLPPEETGLGMPQGATGGGFPDRSTRTGTFGSDTAVPGAGGTRAGR